MDILPDMFNVWLLNYGGLALFILLALGIIALPVPEETLLVFSGYLISQGTFIFIPTFIAAYLGSVCGITVSYLIGSTGGFYIAKKYGSYVGISEKKLAMAHDWFERFGKWVLFIGYFVPGVRHFTGVFAGISTLEYQHFALFAYSGAFFWVLLFLCVGYFFGNYYQNILKIVENNVELSVLTIIAVLLAIAFLRMFMKSRKTKKDIYKD